MEQDVAWRDSESLSPAEEWDRDAAKRTLDELFSLTHQYRSSKAYADFLEFVARFHFYSPFNAMLVHIQMPGATYVAPPGRWLKWFGRRVKANARPLVILRPNGPVMFVFDVSDTEAREGSEWLPPEVESPFEVRGGKVREELSKTIANAGRDGVEVLEWDAGGQAAGGIRSCAGKRRIRFEWRVDKQVKVTEIPVLNQIFLNTRHSKESKYATLVHELGHLYCGHLGTPNQMWWPDRRGLDERTREFEAESVCYLVSGRLGIQNPSEGYLSGFVDDSADTPPISLECVMKAAGLIERMGRVNLKPR